MTYLDSPIFKVTGFCARICARVCARICARQMFQDVPRLSKKVQEYDFFLTIYGLRCKKENVEY